MLPALEIETSSNPDAAVILMHGLGADGNDFAPIVKELGLAPEAAVRFIFPHAPALPVTINGGYVMPAWYDITSMTIDRVIDDQQLTASVNEIAQFVDREIERGIPAGRIVIAGFSQGGAVAYELAATSPHVFAGLLALSSYFASHATVTWQALDEKRQHMPVMIMHGTADQVVPESLGRRAYGIIRDLELEVSYRTFQMEHSVHPQQVREIGDWLRGVLPVQQKGAS